MTDRHSNDSIDLAKDLADKFKKEGHLDNLKKEILSQTLKDDLDLEQFIKSQVKELTQAQVLQDESLVSKNRGTTTALLEGKLFKDGFRELNTEDVNVDELILWSLDNEKLREKIYNILETKLVKKERSDI